MKKTILSLTLIFALYSCTISDSTSADDISPELSGQWEWVRSLGGFVPIYADSVDFTMSLSIHDDEVKMFRDGELITEFTLFRPDKTESDYDDISAILVEPGFEKNTAGLRILEQNRIMLIFNCFDCGRPEFVKRN